MERIELKIYKAGGNKNDVRAVANKWKFQDSMMGEQFITLTVTSEKPIDWAVGDWCEFRGDTFTLNYVPSVTQKGRSGEIGDAYTYDNIKFDSPQEELTRCIMLDITPTTGDYIAALGTNYTGSARFQLFCGETSVVIDGRTVTLTPVCALAAKMQANLDRMFPTLGWKVLVDTETTYTTSSGNVMLVTHTDDKMLSFDNTTVAAALAEVQNTFDLSYSIKGRTIRIGFTLDYLTGDAEEDTFVFGYGHGYPTTENPGLGLFQIKRIANSQQKIVTRLRAMGSTKNLPYRYYNKKYGGDSNPDLTQSLFPTNLQLPGTFLPEGERTDAANAKGSTKWARNNARSEYLRAVKGDTNDSFIDKNDDAENCLEGIREDSARWDGSNSQLPEIYPTIEGVTYGELREAGVEDMDGIAGNTSFQGKTVHPDTERIDSLLAVGYTDNGVLVDDANVGDGITPEETSYNTTVKPAVIGQTKLEYRPSEHGEDMSFEGDEIELFTISNVSPGKYFMAPTGGSYTSVMFSYRLSSASVSASVGYVIRVKQRVGDSTTLIAEYFSAFSSISGTASHEMALPELPDSKDAPGEQVEDITVTALCDVLVTFAPVVSDMRGGRFSLIYQVGRSIIHPNDDYDPEYNWGPVDGGIAANGSFHVFIKDMGFDLTATFTGDTPVMAMKSGRCVGREFEIGENVVPATVNGVKGYLLTLNRVQDSNLGTYYPSETDPIAAGDFFVLLGISMPDAYVEAAEARLLMAATDYLADNCETKFTYQPSIDDIYLQRQHDNMVKAGTPEKSVFSRLYAGLKFLFHGVPERDGDPLPRIDITIQQVTISIGEGLTPKVDIVLNDDVQQSTIQRLTTAVDRIYNGSAYASGGGANLGMLYELLLTEGGKMFLSRINDDTANGKITFNDILTTLSLIKAKGGVNIGEFIPGWLGSGAHIGDDGRGEFEEIYVRGAIRAAELVFNRIRAEEGEAIRSIGHGEILTVDEESQIATLKLEGDEWATIAEGDICRGLYNTVAKDFDNAGNEGQDNNGFRLESGFFASYFKVEQILTNNKGECSFRYSLQTDDQGNVVTEHPCPLMKFAVYGNTDDTKKERQSSMYITAVGIAPRVLFLTGVNYWQIKPWNIKVAIGNIEGIEAYEKTSDGAIQPITLHGDAGLFVEDNIYFGGVIEQFVTAHLDEILDELNGGIHAELLRGSDNIIVDAIGNIVNGIYVQNGETKRYKLHTGVLVYDSRKKMYLVAKAEDDETDLAENEFRISYTCNGCDVLRDGADFYITNIHNTNDGISETVLTDEELALMRETNECSINFVITTANEWRTMMSYPVKITHLDYSYITFDLTNDYDSMSYRTQTKRYEGLPISTTVKAHINGEEAEVKSVTVTSDLFSGSMTSAVGREVTKRLPCGLTIMLNGATLTIDHSNTTGAETDLPDFKHWFNLSSVVKYAGINYESGNMRFTLQETTDATLYKLLVSSNAISKDEGSYTPSSIDVKLQIIGDSGTVVKTESEVNSDSSMKVKIRYINGVYDPNGTNTLLATCPQFKDVSTCFNVLAVDDSNANAPIVYDVQSVTINAKGRDGAGQPYVDSNIDAYPINCNSSGVPLRSHNINIVCSLYWGSDKCVIDSGSYIKYKGSSLALTHDTTANTVSASLYIRNSGTLESSNIEVYITGHEVNDSTKTHSAQKTIAVNAVWAGTDGTDGNDGIGISSIVTYYLITDLYEGVTSQTEQNNWVDEYIDPTVDKPYLWRYTKYTYTDGGTDETPCELVGMYQNKSNPNLLGDTEFLSNSRLDSWDKHGDVHGNEDPEVSKFEIASTYTSDLGHNQFKGAYQASVSGGYINFLHQLVYGGDGVRKVEASSWYTLSFHVYGIKTEIDGVVDDGAFQLDLNLTGLADTDNIYHNGTKVNSAVIHLPLGGNAFQRHVVTFQSKAVLTGNQYVKWDMYTRLYKQEIWLAMPKLEVGKIATPYSPMPAVKEPMARIVEWEVGKTFYQGANGEPYFDMCTYGRRYYKCLRTHVSSNTNKPDESGDTAYWSKANNFRFVATELLLADTGVINLLFSQKLYMRNALGQLAASLNDDGRGSYCMYYPDSGKKMFEVSADKYIYCFRDDEGNTEAWKLGLGGDIEKNESDDWVQVYLAPSSLDVEFERNQQFSLNEYYKFKSGSLGSWKAWNGYYFNGVPTNHNPASPQGASYLNGIYIATSVVLEELGETTDDNRPFVGLYRITNGVLTQEITRLKNADGTYTNRIDKTV